MFNPFKSESSKRSSRKAAKPKAAASSESSEAQRSAVRGERRIAGIISIPHLTEKTSRAGESRWYAFRVESRATKIMIRRAVEDRYSVNVKKIRVINQHPKPMRLGRISGTVPGFKKAMVKVAAGQRIDIQ